MSRCNLQVPSKETLRGIALRQDQKERELDITNAQKRESGPQDREAAAQLIQVRLYPTGVLTLVLMNISAIIGDIENEES